MPKLSIIQFEPHFAENENNFEFIKKSIENDGSDIICFPELATSGYFFKDENQLKDLAIEADSDEIRELQAMSSDLKKIIVLGFPEIDGNEIYNSAAVLMPEKKQSSVYRKTHLFYKERNIFSEGNTGFFTVYSEELDINIGLMICYDWRFPEAARTLALQGADLILCPSNLVTGAWDSVMSARALENKVYIGVANRTGKEKQGREELVFNGSSAIYDYNGKHLTSAGSENEINISCEIFPEKTRDKSFNKINDIFEDRRPDFYFTEE
jgi:predicted amidohydrolase